LTPVHAITHSAINAVGYLAHVRAVTLDIAKDDTREHVVLAGGDVADIAAFCAVGGVGVNADG
jgi:hypothetical protein